MESWLNDLAKILNLISIFQNNFNKCPKSIVPCCLPQHGDVVGRLEKVGDLGLDDELVRLDLHGQLAAL
jgi:hypothetical protein